jgi:Fic-DOC domain mobile mystery protein B
MGEGDDIADATPFDRSGLIARHVRNRTDLFAAEARNIAKATLKYFASRPTRRRAPFTLEWALALHGDMFGDVWEWAGRPRRTNLNLGSPFAQVEVELFQLLQDLAYWREHQTYPPVERAARLHHGAVRIHPFLNGNGRWSRMLANVMLRQEGHPLTEWPDATIGHTSVIRTEYIAAVRAADGGDFGPLLALHMTYTPAPAPPSPKRRTPRLGPENP